MNSHITDYNIDKKSAYAEMSYSEKYFDKYIREQDYPNQLNTLRYGRYRYWEGIVQASSPSWKEIENHELILMAKQDKL